MLKRMFQRMLNKYFERVLQRVLERDQRQEKHTSALPILFVCHSKQQGRKDPSSLMSPEAKKSVGSFVGGTAGSDCGMNRVSDCG